MPTVTDIKEYNSITPKKPVTIPGQKGKQIKIEAVSLQLASGKDGIANTTTISVNGTPYAAWKYMSAKYSDTLTYDKYPFIVGEGENAVLSWDVASKNKKYPAKMKTASYTYLYVGGAPDTPIEENDEFIIIKCKKSETSELIPKIKDIAPGSEINTLSQVE